MGCLSDSFKGSVTSLDVQIPPAIAKRYFFPFKSFLVNPTSLPDCFKVSLSPSKRKVVEAATVYLPVSVLAVVPKTGIKY